MSDEDELEAVTARVVDELTGAAMLFTALDVSNAVKRDLPDARHREISPIVRDLFDRKGMGGYTQTMIDVMAGGHKPARAYLYHLPEQAPTLYDDAMRTQLATPPARAARSTEPPVTDASTEAVVRVGKDGRGRVSRKLLANAGIRGDRVLVQSEPAALRIVAVGSAVVTPVDPLYPLPDLFFSATAQGQPLDIEHPTLLHVPRSLLERFGPAPSLVARIDGATVIVVVR